MSLPYNLHNGAAQQSMLLLLLLSGGRGAAGRPGTGLGGGMTARGWLAPAAARAARPAAARASSASL